MGRCIAHSGYRLMPKCDGKVIEGFQLLFTNPYRITTGIRRQMCKLAKELGLKACFRNPDAKPVFLTDDPDNDVPGTFEERAHRFARRFAHGGEEREDTVLAEIRLLNVA